MYLFYSEKTYNFSHEFIQFLHMSSINFFARKKTEPHRFRSKSWATRIRTLRCWNQNPVPYRLAIAQSNISFLFLEKSNSTEVTLQELGYKDSNLEMLESESSALPFGDSPMCSLAMNCCQSRVLLYITPRQIASIFYFFLIITTFIR